MRLRELWRLSILFWVSLKELVARSVHIRRYELTRQILCGREFVGLPKDKALKAQHEALRHCSLTTEGCEISKLKQRVWYIILQMRGLQEHNKHRHSWPYGQRVIPRLKANFIIVQKMKIGWLERVPGSNSWNHYHHQQKLNLLH